MRMRAALVAGMMAAAVMFGGAPLSEAQPRPGPRGPGAIGGVPRPDPTGQPRRPVRDPRQRPAEGTATLRGRVVDGATGAAIPRAKVRITNRDQRGSRVVTTDAEGVFTMTKVAAGQVVLSAEKASYLTASYPERRRTLRVANLQVSDGQTVDNITIPMFRGGAITGRVVDIYGDPVEYAMVNVFFAPPAGRLAGFQQGARASQSTNDIGEYRIGRLDPGQYYVMVTPQQRRPNEQDDASAAPGRTWYPGVASFDQAQPITIERGASIAGVDLQMLDTTLTKVSGLVMTAKGTPAKRGHITVRTTGASKGMPRRLGRGWSETGGSGVDEYGNFELVLQPGEYSLEATVPQGEEGGRQGRFEVDRGEARLVVGGESMSGVTITTGPGGTASGRFVFKGTSTPPTSMAGFNVNFTGASGETSGTEDCRAYNRSTVNPDGTFSVENMWGSCQFRSGGTAKGWIFEAVMHNGNDITRRVVEFGTAQSISGVEIVYTDRIGEIAMTVADDRGTATDEYVAIVFPVDKEKWGDNRFVRTQTMSPNVNPSQNVAPGSTATRVTATSFDPSTGMVTNDMFNGGATTIRNLLAGDYFAVAVDDAAYEDLRDPEYLERLSQMATRVSLSPGETQTVQLRRVKAPE
jgi:hypothetical protein